MKKQKIDTLSDREKEEKSFIAWSAIFQIRIYAGFLLSILSELNNPNPQIDVGLIIFYIAMYSPLIVCLILFYKKRKSFRIWYIAGAAVLTVITLLSGRIPVLSIAVETFVIIALFQWKYVNENFIGRNKPDKSAAEQNGFSQEKEPIENGKEI